MVWYSRNAAETRGGYVRIAAAIILMVAGVDVSHGMKRVLESQMNG